MTTTTNVVSKRERCFEYHFQFQFLWVGCLAAGWGMSSEQPRIFQWAQSRGPSSAAPSDPPITKKSKAKQLIRNSRIRTTRPRGKEEERLSKTTKAKERHPPSLSLPSLSLPLLRLAATKREELERILLFHKQLAKQLAIARSRQEEAGRRRQEASPS